MYSMTHSIPRYSPAIALLPGDDVLGKNLDECAVVAVRSGFRTPAEKLLV
jgi:hypothetical protein